MQNRIYFFYPSKIIGGAQLLFIRMAKHLSMNKVLQIGIIDYVDGILKTQLAGSDNIEIVEFTPHAILSLPPDTTVITPPSNIATLKEVFDLDTPGLKFLFWSLQPRNVAAAFLDNGRNLSIQKKKLVPDLLELVNNGTIVFMDDPNYWGARDFIGQDFSVNLLPIPFELTGEKARPSFIRDTKINIAWLGRISFEKVYSIIDIIDQISQSKDRANITFHIIGDGPKKTKVLAHAQKCGVKCNFVGLLLDRELDDYIIEKIDIGVAMGTSCLEFAARRIPAVLLDYSYKKFPGKVKYRWLFETKGYALGQLIHLQNDRTHEFQEIVNCGLNRDCKEMIGNKCHVYVSQYHNITGISSALLKHVEKIRNTPQLETLKRLYVNANPVMYKRFIMPLHMHLVALKRRFLGE